MTDTLLNALHFNYRSLSNGPLRPGRIVSSFYNEETKAPKFTQLVAIRNAIPTSMVWLQICIRYHFSELKSGRFPVLLLDSFLEERDQYPVLDAESQMQQSRVCTCVGMGGREMSGLKMKQ